MLKRTFTKILAVALAAATLAAANVLSSAALSLPGAKFIYTEDGYIDGVLSKNGTLYIYDGEFNRQTIARDVEDAWGHFFLQKGKLYNRLTMKSVVSNVTMTPFINVVMTKSGAHYFIIDDTVVKPPKKVFEHSFNNYGDFVLFTSDKEWDGAYYSVYKNGWIDFSEPVPGGNPVTERKWYSVNSKGELVEY